LNQDGFRGPGEAYGIDSFAGGRRCRRPIRGICGYG
jgi:hypothetical protein